jgi:hypothetical protein
VWESDRARKVLRRAWLHTDWIGAAVEKRQAVSAGCAPGSREAKPMGQVFGARG